MHISIFPRKIYNKECLKYKIIFSKDCYNFGMGPAINPVFGAWRASTVQKAFPLHVANLSLVPNTTYGSLNTTNSKPRAQGQKQTLSTTGSWSVSNPHTTSKSFGRKGKKTAGYRW